MDDGTSTVPPMEPEKGCMCACKECAVDKNCAACSHKLSEEGCHCDGCMCNEVPEPAEPPEPPMAM